jgi:hypothetical protein
MENLTPIFIALTGAAVVMQAGVLVALYLAVRKSSTKMEALAEEVKTKALPTLDTAQAMLTELRPKLQVISDNLMETTVLVRNEVERVDATVSDATGPLADYSRRRDVEPHAGPGGADFRNGEQNCGFSGAASVRDHSGGYRRLGVSAEQSWPQERGQPRTRSGAAGRDVYLIRTI